MPEQAAARKLFSKGARTVKINLFRLALALLACTLLSGQAAWALTPEQFNMLKEKAEAGNRRKDAAGFHEGCDGQEPDFAVCFYRK